MSSAWLSRLAEICGPPAGVDALLQAWLADDQTAAAWTDFERHADLDHLPGPEMCLVGLVAQRLPTIAPSSKLCGRIGGIERVNWSRTQLALREAATAFHELNRHDIPVLLVGNATRCARGDSLGRGRRIERVDCCVRSADLPATHDRLLATGWVPLALPVPSCLAGKRESVTPVLNFLNVDFLTGTGRASGTRSLWHTVACCCSHAFPRRDTVYAISIWNVERHVARLSKSSSEKLAVTAWTHAVTSQLGEIDRRSTSGGVHHLN
ncbi:MAG: hypothetical protein ACKPEY_00955 [Planctomycetota bacterium]